MRAQYLSTDAIIAAIMFIILVVSLFSYMRFSLFSQQFYEEDIDSATAYVSSLLLSLEGGSFSLVDNSKPGKIIDPNRLPNVGTNIKNSIPYRIKIRLNCPGFSDAYIPLYTTPTKWVSHVRRSAVAEFPSGNKVCAVDVYLGVETIP